MKIGTIKQIDVIKSARGLPVPPPKVEDLKTKYNRKKEKRNWKNDIRREHGLQV